VERSAAEAEVPPDGEGERGWLAASTLEWPWPNQTWASCCPRLSERGG
jgi:hypothetical protein